MAVSWKIGTVMLCSAGLAGGVIRHMAGRRKIVLLLVHIITLPYGGYIPWLVLDTYR